MLHLLALLDEPSKGNIIINSQETKNLSNNQKDEFRRKIISIIFQDNNLLNDFSAIENVMMPLIIRGEKKKIIKNKAEKILKDVKILNRSNHFPSELSGGEQQRVAIAKYQQNQDNFNGHSSNLDFKTSKIFSIFLKLKKLKKLLSLQLIIENLLTGLITSCYF